MYLLDTMVLSEMRKRRANPHILQWLNDKRRDTLFLSVVSISEIEQGIERQRSVNPDFAEALVEWFDELLDEYEDRILPVDSPIARRWGRLAARVGHAGNDLLIAATALEHGLTIATRNVRHFAPTGVTVENPFEAQR